MSQNKIRIKRIFDDFQTDSVYVYGDRHDGYEPALIQVANKMGIPVIIPPIAYGSDKEGLLKYKRREFQVLNTHDVTNLHSIKSQFHYQWRYDYVSRRDISYYPPLSLSVRAECNILPHNPWTLGGGYSDKVCVSGEFEFQRFILNGVPSHKISITGRLDDDKLYQAFINREVIKSNLLRKYNLANNPIIIAALPQLFEHDLASKDDHWHIQFTILRALQRLDGMFLSHCQMNKQDYQSAFSDYDITCRRKTRVLAAACFRCRTGSLLFLGEYFASSTVILDWYGLNYSSSDWIDGKIIVKDESKLEAILTELTQDASWRSHVRRLYSLQKKAVSPFDGRSLERILDLGLTV